MVLKYFLLLLIAVTSVWAKDPAATSEQIRREAHEYRKRELKAQWEFEDKQEAELRNFRDQTTKEARETLLKQEDEIFASANATSDALLKQRREKMIRDGKEQIRRVTEFQAKLKKDLQDFLAIQKKERDAFNQALKALAPPRR